jgi:hypothetical protein
MVCKVEDSKATSRDLINSGAVRGKKETGGSYLPRPGS